MRKKATKVDPKLIGAVDQAQIDTWKTNNPLGVYALTAGGHIAYFKQPGFDELNYGFSQLSPDAMVSGWREFAENTLLGGSEELLTNATLFSGIVKHFQKKVDGAKAEVVDL